jgi:hypothetical protein
MWIIFTHAKPLTQPESNPDPPISVHKMSLSITDNTPALQALVPTPPRHFRDLPKEVRNRIYYFLFKHPAEVGYRTDGHISM